MKITFLGAAHEVTGSCTMLEVGGTVILVDYGMEQGRDTFVNQKLLVDASAIDFVLLTHAHIDHSGNLPLLYKNGFKGKVYTTKATESLCKIMLMDSAHIQVSDVERANRKAKRSGNAQEEPLYDMDDAAGILNLFRPCPYGERIQISENIQIRFIDIGHLLGSSSIEIWLTESGKTRKLVFSGDIGNVDKPMLKAPQTIKKADYVIIESTYGNREHTKIDSGSLLAEFRGHIKRTIDRGGNVVIPSFAVGRAQELLYMMRQINNDNLATGKEPYKVYLDSPLADQATSVFLQCDNDCFDADTKALLDKGINPLIFEGLNISESTQESIDINSDISPKIIISASGMCEAGRIRHHLKHNLWRKENLILFAGFQSAGTLGRILVDGATSVKLFGEEISVSAEVAILNGISGHADKAGLIDWLSSFEKQPQHIFVNHGEDEVCTEFAACLSGEYGYNATAPFSGTSYDLISGEALVITEGVPVVKDTPSGSQGRDPRAVKAYNNLLESAAKLTEIIKSAEGMSNKDLAKFANKIDKLSEKWKL